jgi:hypothetical protein
LLVVAFSVMTTRAAELSTRDEIIAPVKRIDVYVLPYYEAAQTPDGKPIVSVGKSFDLQLASSKQADIVAVRDAIQAQPQRITPMTLMVLAIRLYDVGLRDEAAFWFYVAKNRYVTMADVLNVKSPDLAQVEDAVRNFAILAGPLFNGYAFCDGVKQREISLKSLEWVERNPYEVIFMEQLPALPGDRILNLKKSVSRLKGNADKEQLYLSDPKNLEELSKSRKANHINEKFCWSL